MSTYRTASFGKLLSKETHVQELLFLNRDENHGPSVQKSSEEYRGTFRNMLKAALYARVSTRDQKSIPDQLADLRTYAKLKDFEVVAEYEEKESGKRDTRPIRYELLRRAWKREFDAVLVWKLDRWGRNVQDLVTTVADLANHDIGFVSFSDNIDLTTTNGRLFFHILCAFAQFERETTVDRVRAGIRKKRARMEELGRTWGRPPTARAKSAEVFELAAVGKSKAAIAKATGISRASVIRILRNDQNGVRTRNPPI